MIDLNCIIPYNPEQPSARRSRAPAKWREPPGQRVYARNLPRLGSTQDDAIILSDALTSDDLNPPGSVGFTPVLGSLKATPPLQSTVDGIADLLDEIDQSAPSNLPLQGPVGKAGLSDDDYLDIDDALSTTGKSGVGSALSPRIRLHDLELSHTEDKTSGCNSQATLCASSGQSKEPSDDIRRASALGGTSQAHSSNTEQVAERAILESSIEPTTDDGCTNSQVSLIETVLQSQQEPGLVLGDQPECGHLSPPESAASEEKERTPDHWIEGVGHAAEPEERSLNKKPSVKRARSLSASPKPAKRRQDASDAHHKMSRRRRPIAKRPIDGVQSATAPDGDWLIDGIVGERQGAEGREFMVQWRPTWVPAKDVNAEDCEQRWREQKRRLED